MLENKWALVVEDDAHNLLAISGLLRDLGVRFKRNTTGANVLEQLRAMQPTPDFIILDVDLPHGDAFTIKERLRADAKLRNIPVITIGEGALADQPPQVLHAGFAGYIPKPLPRKRFGDIIRRVLSGEQVWEVAV